MTTERRLTLYILSKKPYQQSLTKMCIIYTIAIKYFENCTGVEVAL